MATDDEVVQTAADAAEDVIFARLSVSDIDDYDVTVSFEDGMLDVDIYVKAPDASADEKRIADDAALAARGAVDELLS
ncbi:DUF3194 domain-containing protein [Haloarcula sediminis]|uniref:DUF3194 domain-containing protein n=1 Tax=Haloarcula sediminis TaxID=3111777 RepID=UPI002D76C556|nr:DUF3194 domain-containing protein [Haloarcula sp. CK38]